MITDIAGRPITKEQIIELSLDFERKGYNPRQVRGILDRYFHNWQEAFDAEFKEPKIIENPTDTPLKTGMLVNGAGRLYRVTRVRKIGDVISFDGYTEVERKSIPITISIFKHLKNNNKPVYNLIYSDKLTIINPEEESKYLSSHPHTRIFY